MERDNILKELTDRLLITFVTILEFRTLFCWFEVVNFKCQLQKILATWSLVFRWIYEDYLAHLFSHQKCIKTILCASDMLKILNLMVGKVDTNPVFTEYIN